VNVAVKPGLVSVVVASYNHAEYLTQRMESLIGQTYRDIEILVIDDCSPDNSVEVLRRFESHPKVKLLIREKNGGWVTVSNQGVEMATGEFVIFANCDDDCDPHMIERLVGAMNANPTAGIAFCRSLLVDGDGHILGDDFAIREQSFRARCLAGTLLTQKEMSRFLLHSCVIPNLSAALIRKECFSTVGKLSPNYRVCSDWDLFFRIVTRYDVAYIAEPLNKFRQHDTTIRSVTKGRVTYEEFFRLLLGQIRFLDLTFFERCHFRTRVMYLWGAHLFSQPWAGLRNFPYHLSRVSRLDPLALVFFVPGLVLCVLKIAGMAGNKLGRTKEAR
jgi:glycosyltransferase involved in cell wall biosynthesis